MGNDARVDSPDLALHDDDLTDHESEFDNGSEADAEPERVAKEVEKPEDQRATAHP
ncbi:uncharacterized protein B0T15DRAFT_490233 [Chaetomium strumarium]|uniref:Uncharacterized protein n=1 Tax=Chaetomium strumarium TaxID=1170767 RepID=A0AAJ0H4F8_9PEZI|nr:hypothetical protein B0T15DRAFT_490233 [Chaetomium strumarium]